MDNPIGYTTAAEVERLRAGKTAVVQGERSDACTVAVRLGEDDAVGSAVKAEPVTPDLQWGKRTPEGSWLACNNRDKLAEITAHFDGPIVPVTVEWDTNGDCKIEPALSTHTAAGAGLAGEAVTRDDYLSDAQARELFGLEDDEALDEDRIRVCQGEWVRIPGGYYFDKSVGLLHPETANDEACDDCAVSIARPVDEPSEVERDEAPQTDGGFLTKSERAAIDKLGEATALRRELAETRESLKEVEAAAKSVMPILDGQLSSMTATETMIRRETLRQTLFRSQALGGALTGDAQEAGR